jgi:signal transduction histidine kinase/ligand-binding sensor domain-containing protein
MLASLALCAFLQAAPASSAAPAYHASLWTIANGLPQGSVNAMAVSAAGELWLATFGGLVAFDGMRFRSFDLDTLERLPSNRITALRCGADDEVWFTTQPGELVRFQAGRIQSVYPLPKPHLEPLCLLRHPDGAFWLQTSAGAVLRFLEGQWTVLLPAGAGGGYSGMCVDSQGQVWVAQGKLLLRLDAQGVEQQRLEAPARVSALCAGGDDRIWVGMQSGVALMRAGELRPWNTQPRIEWAVNAIQEASNGHVWFGTQRGLVHGMLDVREGERTWVSSNGLSLPAGLEVRSLLLDPEGNLWMGTTAAGLARLRPSRIDTVPALRRLGSTSALASDGEGGAWVGSECRGLTRVLRDTRELRPERVPEIGGLEHCPSALFLDSRRRLWLGSATAFLRRDTPDSSWELIVSPAQMGRRSGPMQELDNGEFLLCMQDGEWLQLDATDGIRARGRLGVSIQSMVRGPDGRVWIGTDQGVLRWSEGRAEPLAVESGFPRAAIRDFHFASDGSIWMATYGAGILCFDSGSLHSLGRAQGLPNGSISKVLSDGRRLWASSNLGLIVLEWSQLKEWRAGRRERVEAVIYGPEAGLGETNHGQPAGFADDALWFGSLSGIVRVDPSRFPFNPRPPLPRLERLLADEQPLSDDWTVPPGARRLAVEYGAISLTASERVRFRHRLLGFDDAWTDAGETRVASFTDLRPGEYRWEFQARNEDGIWSASLISPAITVIPQWWERRWVQWSALLALGASLLLMHRLRIRALQRRTAVLVDATRGRMLAEQRESVLRDELAHVARVATAGELATSLAHEVNQPLGAIVHNTHAASLLLERGQAGEVREILQDIGVQAERASAVVRRLREFLRKNPRRTEAADLNSLIETTLPLLRREIASAGVQVSLELTKGLPAVQVDLVQLQQVFVNLIQNACEALNRQAGERRLSIRTLQEGSKLVFEFEDNGPGLAADIEARIFEPYVTTKPGGMGLGLAICRSIMELHAGHLYAQRAMGKGLLFRGDLPLHS